MTAEHLEVLVEEQSMETFLRLLLPGILDPGVSFAVYDHHGKDRLLTTLPSRLRGYARFLPESWRILVLVDRDDDDCHELKARLEDACRDAGLPTCSHPVNGRFRIVNRIVIEELEAWYFGDWQAVRRAYPKVGSSVPSRAPYRDPDAIRGGTWEAFERLLRKAGYYETGLAKIEAARAIAPHVDPERQRSHSFRVFHQALADLGVVRT